MTFSLVNADIDSTCSEFENGTALHIAASNLAHEAIKVLIQNGANPSLKDDLGRIPLGEQTKQRPFVCYLFS
jgi:ankyrin repeat protein